MDEHAEQLNENPNIVEGEWATTDAPGVTDEHTATLHRYVRLMKRLDDEETRANEMHLAVMGNIENRRKALEAFYEPMARQVAASLLEGKKERSLKTPWGVVGFRSQPSRFKIENADALVAHARNLDLNDWIAVKTTTTEKPNFDAVETYFKSTGDVPPGCLVTAGGDSFYVK